MWNSICGIEHMVISSCSPSLPPTPPGGREGGGAGANYHVLYSNIIILHSIAIIETVQIIFKHKQNNSIFRMMPNTLPVHVAMYGIVR